MSSMQPTVFIQVRDGDNELWSDIYPSLNGVVLRLITQEISKGYTVSIERGTEQ